MGGQGQGRLCVSARALKLRQVGWCRWRREEPRELLSTRYARSKRDLHDARQTTIDGRDNVSGATRSRFEARRYAYRLTYRLLFHDRSTEIEAPLLFLQEADARRVLAGASASRVCGIGIRIHIHCADPVLVAESFGFQHDHEFTLSTVRRLDVDAKDARTGRGVDAEHFRLTRAAFEADLDIALGERLEGIQLREMNREAGRATDDQRRILREQLRLVSPSRHTQRLGFFRRRWREARLDCNQRRQRRSGVSTDVSGPQDVSHCAFQGDLCQARLKPQIDRPNSGSGRRPSRVEQFQDADLAFAVRHDRNLHELLSGAWSVLARAPPGEAPAPRKHRQSRSGCGTRSTRAPPRHARARLSISPLHARPHRIGERRRSSRTPPPVSRPDASSARFMPPKTFGEGSRARRAASPSKVARSASCCSARSSARVELALVISASGAAEAACLGSGPLAIRVKAISRGSIPARIARTSATETAADVTSCRVSRSSCSARSRSNREPSPSRSRVRRISIRRSTSATCACADSIRA